jgi:hypothetical protein
MTGLAIDPAGAGAGKTYRIEMQLTDWVRSKTVRPERILAVTFTGRGCSYRTRGDGSASKTTPTRPSSESSWVSRRGFDLVAQSTTSTG